MVDTTLQKRVLDALTYLATLIPPKPLYPVCVHLAMESQGDDYRIDLWYRRPEAKAQAEAEILIGFGGFNQISLKQSRPSRDAAFSAMRQSIDDWAALLPKGGSNG